ncbi:MAG: hypothetical protein WCF16_10250 [Alphaproteobacteria bacterium]
MSVDPISSGLGGLQSARLTQFVQTRNYFSQLAQSLTSGDLSGAQQAFTSLQQILQSSGQAGAQGDKNNPSGQSKIQQDLATVGQALQSGDIAGAQKAFASLQQDLQAARLAHHHHGGGAKPADVASNSGTVAGADADGDQDGSSGTSGVNVTA